MLFLVAGILSSSRMRGSSESTGTRDRTISDSEFIHPPPRGYIEEKGVVMATLSNGFLLVGVAGDGSYYNGEHQPDYRPFFSGEEIEALPGHKFDVFWDRVDAEMAARCKSYTAAAVPVRFTGGVENVVKVGLNHKEASIVVCDRVVVIE